MILELADIRIKTGASDAFEKNVQIALATIFPKSKGFLEFSPVSVVFDRKTEHVSLWCSKVDAQSKRSRSRSASKRTTSAHAKVEQGTALLLFLRTATVLRLLLSH